MLKDKLEKEEPDISLMSDDFREQLTLQEAKFIFEQAEKILLDTVKTGEIIASRMTMLLTILSGSFIGLLSFVISRLDNVTWYDPLFFCAGVGGVYTFALVCVSFHNIQPKSYHIAGTSITAFFNPAFFSDQIQEGKRLINYYVNEAQRCDAKSTVNRAINMRRWMRFWVIVKAVMFLHVILAICYLSTR